MIRVRVTRARGSTPREEGAEMFVGLDSLLGTIGGGHLEWRAMEIAQTMMNAPEAAGEARRQFVRIPLGPALGQCCGGVVRLSLGDNSELGGTVGGGYVRWNFFTDLTVTVNGQLWVKDGRLVSPP